MWQDIEGTLGGAVERVLSSFAGLWPTLIALLLVLLFFVLLMKAADPRPYMRNSPQSRLKASMSMASEISGSRQHCPCRRNLNRISGSMVFTSKILKKGMPGCSRN